MTARLTVGARLNTTRGTMKYSVKTLVSIIVVGIIKASVMTSPLWMR